MANKKMQTLATRLALKLAEAWFALSQAREKE